MQPCSYGRSCPFLSLSGTDSEVHLATHSHDGDIYGPGTQTWTFPSQSTTPSVPNQQYQQPQQLPPTTMNTFSPPQSQPYAVSQSPYTATQPGFMSPQSYHTQQPSYDSLVGPMQHLVVSSPSPYVSAVSTPPHQQPQQFVHQPQLQQYGQPLQQQQPQQQPYYQTMQQPQFMQAPIQYTTTPVYPYHGPIQAPVKRVPCASANFCADSSLEHQQYFTHPCALGAACHELSNSEHVALFTHDVSQPTTASAPTSSKATPDIPIPARTGICKHRAKCRMLLRVQHGKPGGSDQDHLSRFKHPGSTLPGQQVVVPSLQAPCKDGHACTNIKDTAHTSQQRHPCSNGMYCKLIGDVNHEKEWMHMCPTPTSCKDMDDPIHTALFIHPCKLGKQCTITDAAHKQQEAHPCMQCKPGQVTPGLHEFMHIHPCSDAGKCTKMNDWLHMHMYEHMCPQDKTCTQRADSNHCEIFLHTCTAVLCTDATLSHQLRFVHVVPAQPSTQATQAPPQAPISLFPTAVQSTGTDRKSVV